MILNLGSNKGDKNYDSSTKMTHLKNSLWMSLFETSENDLSHGEGTPVSRKVRTSLVK